MRTDQILGITVMLNERKEGQVSLRGKTSESFAVASMLRALVCVLVVALAACGDGYSDNIEPAASVDSVDSAVSGVEEKGIGTMPAVAIPSNLALGKPTDQSSVTHGGTSERAVDGNTDGTFSEESVTHTSLESQPWWEVDLLQPSALRSIRIWNRTDCCADRLSAFVVFVSDTSMQGRSLAQLTADPNVTEISVASLKGASNIDLPVTAFGRYVRVQLKGRGHLSLAEVEVSGVVGSNLAKNMHATQSSTTEGGPALLAVDGVTRGNFAAGEVTQTEQENQPWWQVDLGQQNSLEAVRIWNRTDCCADRLKNFTVFVSAADMARRTFSQLNTDPRVFKLKVGAVSGASVLLQAVAQGRYVRVQLNGGGYLSLAEVQVFGQAGGQPAGKAINVPISNPNFEAQKLDDGSIANGPISGWSGGSGVYNPSGLFYGALAGSGTIGTMAGPNVGFLYGPGVKALEQTSLARALEDATYVLTVALGGRSRLGEFAGAVLELTANGEVVASRGFETVPVRGSFGDSTLRWKVPDGLEGASIGVRIRPLAPAKGRYVDVDNVRLTYSVASSQVATAISEDCSSKRNTSGADVVLLMGQSNMSGYGARYDAAIDGPNNPRVQQWSRNSSSIIASEHLEHFDYRPGWHGVGPGTAFGRAYLATLPAKRHVLLVPTAQGSTALVNGPWSPGGYLFEDAMQRLQAALASDSGNCVAAVLWMQGESDVFRNRSTAQYRDALKSMISTLRDRVPRAAKAPFVMGEFTPGWMQRDRAKFPVDGILQALHDVATEVDYTAVVSSSGLGSNSDYDIIHFSAASQRTYGQRYFHRIPNALANWVSKN